ncbi:MAG: heavy metal translocating P-type ATPase [Pseudomonadota bacterium]
MSRSPGICDLCGLPLRHGKVRSDFSGRTFHFCCMGCRQVFQMLLENSESPDPASFRETALFRKCLEMGVIPRTEADLQEKTPCKPLPRQTSDNILTLDLRVDQMWCPACAWVIEETLKKTKGVMEANCSFSTDRCRCTYDPVLTSPTQVMGIIAGLGYWAAFPDEEEGKKETFGEFIRFGISAFLTMNVMMLSFGLYSGFFTELSQETVRNLSWPIFVMAGVVLFYGGHRIIQRAWAGFFQAAFGMETLITLGAVSAYVYSTWNLLFVGSIHLYYDTASMLITLVLLGKALEGKAKGEVRRSLETLFSMRPTKVKVCTQTFPGGRYAAVEQLEKGDVFRSEEGEIVAADGLVLEGRGVLDESTLTGESVPVPMKPGDRLRAGTRVIHGAFRVRAEGVGDESTFGGMIRIMEKALGGKTRFEGKTDVALQWFVPVVLALAAGTGLVCLAMGLSLEESIVRAITVMVISCPCTLGVAVPLARVAGISLAGKRGVLVRHFAAFEKAGRIDAFVFDKTGTLTAGQWEILRVIAFPPFDETRAFALAASLERDSDHFIGMKIRMHADEKGIGPEDLKDMRTFKNGISGRMGNREVRIGSRDFVSKAFESAGPLSLEDSEREGSTQSFVYLGFDDRPCAVFVFGDRIKERASETVERLRAMGLRIDLLSGDGEETTRAVGQRVGIREAHGGKMPQDKAAYITGLQKEGHQVAMVGDGINDAPALVQADLSISVHSGSSLNSEASDMTLMRGDPGQIPGFLDLAKSVNRKIHQNLAFSFMYNLVGIPIAMSGLLTPLIAVCAMLMSSLAVTVNTLLLLKNNGKRA